MTSRGERKELYLQVVLRDGHLDERIAPAASLCMLERLLRAFAAVASVLLTVDGIIRRCSVAHDIFSLMRPLVALLAHWFLTSATHTRLTLSHACAAISTTLSNMHACFLSLVNSRTARICLSPGGGARNANAFPHDAVHSRTCASWKRHCPLTHSRLTRIPTRNLCSRADS